MAQWAATRSGDCGWQWEQWSTWEAQTKSDAKWRNTGNGWNALTSAATKNDEWNACNWGAVDAAETRAFSPWHCNASEATSVQTREVQGGTAEAIPYSEVDRVAHEEWRHTGNGWNAWTSEARKNDEWNACSWGAVDAAETRANERHPICRHGSCNLMDWEKEGLQSMQVTNSVLIEDVGGVYGWTSHLTSTLCGEHENVSNAADDFFTRNFNDFDIRWCKAPANRMLTCGNFKGSSLK